VFLTKNYLSRRTLIRGAGVTLALPFLESMVPAQTPLANTAANPKTRFIGVFSAHGWAPTYWNDGRPDEPPTPGRNVGLGFIHTPLEPFKEQLTIIGGLDSTSSMPPPGSSGGDHARAAAALTGAAPKKTSGADIRCGASIDQIIAKKYGQDSLLPSLQIAIEDPGAATGVCGWGYSCAYTNSISWAGPTKPLPHEINPQVIFERLFGDGATPEERLARKRTNGSILDTAIGEVARLEQRLPGSDRARLGDYLESVREVERRLQLSVKRSNEAPEMPIGVPQTIDDHIKLIWDLQLLAFQADITRVSALLFARDESNQTYPDSGVTAANHASSHHGEDPARREIWAKINRYQMKTLAYFLKKARETKDGDGSLLDHSLLLWTSNMGNANQHSHVNVGSLLVGGASGRHKAKLNVMEQGPTANMLLGALHLFGIPDDSIGDSTKPLSFT
jgi:hypothetical protein